jgi:biopolymer transport protein ExbD
MCATKFSGDERKFDLDLPQAGSAAAVDGSRPEILEVEASGGLRLGGDDVAIAELPARLADLRAGRPDLAVMIRGENAVPHGRMAEVYEACRTAGVTKVAISVRPKAGNGGTTRR